MTPGIGRRSTDARSLAVIVKSCSAAERLADLTLYAAHPVGSKPLRAEGMRLTQNSGIP